MNCSKNNDKVEMGMIKMEKEMKLVYQIEKGMLLCLIAAATSHTKTLFSSNFCCTSSPIVNFFNKEPSKAIYS